MKRTSSFSFVTLYVFPETMNFDPSFTTDFEGTATVGSFLVFSIGFDVSGSLAISSVFVFLQLMQVYVFSPADDVVGTFVTSPLFQ